MDILRPKKIRQEPFSVIVSVTNNFEFTEAIHGVTMTKSITTIALNSKENNNVEFPHQPTDEQKRVFAGMQGLIKSCVDNAEDIKNRIHQIIINRDNPNSEAARVAIMKMDFMATKKWFMDDIRSSKIYKHFFELNSTEKLKPFSQAFNSFILDRNKYTHGQLCFISPSYEYAIEYIETPEQQKEYAKIDIELLKSYNAFYKAILKVISEYNIAHQEKT